MTAAGPEDTGTGEPGYEDASRWASAASLVYRPLAEALVACAPVALPPGARVLDVGTGTGLVADALGDGVAVVGVDRSPVMLGYRREARPPAVNADARALPFAPASFDAWIASFLLNHLPPEEPLREAARVVRPGGVVLASSWPATQDDPVKQAIDEIAGAAGWVAPEWHQAMKRELDAVAGDPGSMVEIAGRAGLAGATGACVTVAIHAPSAAAVVDYRLALPHYTSWTTLADPATIASVRAEAARAIEPFVFGWEVEMVVLSARVSPDGQ